MAVGVWTWLIWPRFAVAIWQDARAWQDGDPGGSAPTSFFWVHALLIVTSLAVGTAIGVLGIQGWRSHRRGERNPRPEMSVEQLNRES